MSSSPNPRLAVALAAVLLSPACATSPVPAADLSEALAGGTFTRQGDYVISAADRVAVKVYGQEALSGTYTVSSSGVMTFPLIGYVQASGLTTLQLTERLQKALQPYVKAPIVTVSVTDRDSYQVYFSGALGRPGGVVLQSRTTLLQGLALGGGLTDDASGRILLLRQMPDGSVRRYATTYRALLTGRDGLDRFVLERGDVVHAE